MIIRKSKSYRSSYTAYKDQISKSRKFGAIQTQGACDGPSQMHKNRVAVLR